MMVRTASFGNSKIGWIARTPFSKSGQRWMKIEMRRARRDEAIQISLRPANFAKGFFRPQQIERQLSYFRGAIGGTGRSIQIEMTRCGNPKRARRNSRATRETPSHGNPGENHGTAKRKDCGFVIRNRRSQLFVAASERPRTYTFEPPSGEPRSNIVPEPHSLPIRDVRPISGSLSLDREGFALVRQESAVKDFYNDDEIKAVYYPEAEQLIKAATGADRVFVFDHTVRKRVPGAADIRDGVRVNPSRGCMSITPQDQAHIASAISSPTRPMSS